MASITGYLKAQIDSLLASKATTPTTGTASSSTFWRGDNVWAVPPSTGTSGGVSATVDGSAVTALTFSSAVTAADVSALPLPTGTPTAGQVPVVSTASPLAMKWGSAGSGSSISTSTIIKPETYGGKGDGVILLDLVVTQGSASISSAAGPFTSTAADAGKLVYWRSGVNSVATGIIASVQSSTQATLTQNAPSGSMNDGGPNGDGCFGTDNTSALNQAMAAAQAGTINVTSSSTYRSFRVGAEVHLSAGVWVHQGLAVLTGANVTVTGEGRFATYLCSGAAGAWFQIGTFNQSATYAFPSTDLNFSFRHMQFINPCFANGDSAGGRTSIGIQDNGNGSVDCEDLYMTGMKFGYASPYGGDFSRQDNCYYYNCDVGTYFGPGGQQLEFTNCDWSLCREGAVFEGVQNWHVGGNPHFQDNTIASVHVVGSTSTTRFGVASNIGGGAWYQGVFLIDGAPWFESNSGGNDQVAPRQVWVDGDGPYGPAVSGLVVRDAILISGGTQVSGGHNTFVELTSGQTADMPVLIDNLNVGGTFINSIFRNSGTASNVQPQILRTYYDSTKINLTDGSCAPRYLTRAGGYHGFTAI